MKNPLLLLSLAVAYTATAKAGNDFFTKNYLRESLEITNESPECNQALGTVPRNDKLKTFLREFPKADFAQSCDLVEKAKPYLSALDEVSVSCKSSSFSLDNFPMAPCERDDDNNLCLVKYAHKENEISPESSDKEIEIYLEVACKHACRNYLVGIAAEVVTLKSVTNLKANDLCSGADGWKKIPGDVQEKGKASDPSQVTCNSDDGKNCGEGIGKEDRSDPASPKHETEEVKKNGRGGKSARIKELLDKLQNGDTEADNSHPWSKNVGAKDDSGLNDDENVDPNVQNPVVTEDASGTRPKSEKSIPDHASTHLPTDEDNSSASFAGTPTNESSKDKKDAKKKVTWSTTDTKEDDGDNGNHSKDTKADNSYPRSKNVRAKSHVDEEDDSDSNDDENVEPDSQDPVVTEDADDTPPILRSPLDHSEETIPDHASTPLPVDEDNSSPSFAGTRYYATAISTVVLTIAIPLLS